MNIAISGASGYIGKCLKKELNKKYTFLNVPREMLKDSYALRKLLANVDVIIVLNGYPIIQRWNRGNKQKIERSRIDSVKAIESCIKRYKLPIKLVITASAIGAYGNYDFSNEDSSFEGNTFLTDLIKNWEDIEFTETRVVNLRIGVVLGRESGFIKNVKLNMLLGLNVLFGNRQVPISVISIVNLIRIVDFVIKNEQLKGSINTVEPFTISQFVLFKMLKKYNVTVVIPASILRLIFGKASVLLCEGQKVIPEKLLKSGFKFNTVDFKSIFTA